MNKHSFFLGITTLLFSIYTLAPLSYADIDFKHLKGTHSFLGLRPECSHLSPEIALNLLRGGQLNQKYLYGDEQDPTIQLIRMGFNSVSENAAFFQVSPLGSGIARFLTPTLIGELLGQLNQTRLHGKSITPNEISDLILNHSDFQKNIQESELKKREEEKRKELHLADLTGKLKDYKLKLSQLETSLPPAAGGQCHGSNGTEFNQTLVEQIDQNRNTIEPGTSPLNQPPSPHIELRHKIKALEDQIEADTKKLNSEIAKYRYESKNLKAFSKLVSQALESDQQSSITPNRTSVDQILLSIGWHNGTSKQDLLSLYHRLPSACFTEHGHKALFSNHPTDQALRIQWLGDQFSQQDYIQLAREALTKSPQEKAEYFFDHPDVFAFLAYGKPFYDSSALPVIGFKQVEFTHPTLKAKVRMSDCMESAILNNLLNALAGGEGNKFNVAALEENLRKEGYQMHPGLKAFLTKYPDLSRVNDLDAHKLWAELVSDLPDVNYNPIHPTYEIVPTVSNALAVYGHLLFHTRSPSTSSAYKDRSRSQKLDLICKVLSRNWRELSWKLNGSTSNQEMNATEEEIKSGTKKDTDLTLHFSINSTPTYNWNLTRTHSYVTHNSTSSSNWIDTSIGMAMAGKLLNPSFASPQKWNALTWLFDTQQRYSILSSLESLSTQPIYQELLWSLPLEITENKVLFIEKLAQNYTSAGAREQDHILSLINKLHAKLPPDDLHTQVKFIDIVDAKHLSQEALKESCELTRRSLLSNPKDAVAVVTDYGSPTSLQYLIEGNVDLASPIEGRIPLTNIITSYTLDDSQKIVLAKALIEHLTPEQLSLTGYNKNTALHFAVGNRHPEIASLLVAKLTEKQITLANPDGNTALDFAFATQQDKIAQMLIDKFPLERLIQPSGESRLTALQAAAAMGMTNSVMLLLKRLPHEAITKPEFNPILHAISGGSVEVVLRLIEILPQEMLGTNNVFASPLYTMIHTRLYTHEQQIQMMNALLSKLSLEQLSTAKKELWPSLAPEFQDIIEKAYQRKLNQEN